MISGGKYKKLEDVLSNTLDLALKRRARWLVEELKPKRGDRILDVGCGDGYYLHLLSALGLGLNLVGADSDKRALVSAEKNLKDKKVKLVFGDIMERLPFEDEVFDKVVMSEVLEHLPDDEKGLLEVERVLKKGGILVISVPNANYPFLWDPVNWILEHIFKTHIKSGFWAGIWNQHERLYKGQQLVKLVKKVGFKVGKAESLTSWCLPFNHNIVNLGARILANKKDSAGLTRGADKFVEDSEKSKFIKLYQAISSFVDSWNDLHHFNVDDGGVSMLLKAIKK